MPKKANSWKYRAFLRPANTDDGLMSAISADCSVGRCGNCDDKMQGNISAGLTFRDCSGDVSFCFYASNKRKYALAELKAIQKIADVVDRLEAEYAEAIATMDREDLW